MHLSSWIISFSTDWSAPFPSCQEAQQKHHSLRQLTFHREEIIPLICIFSQLEKNHVYLLSMPTIFVKHTMQFLIYITFFLPSCQSLEFALPCVCIITNLHRLENCLRQIRQLSVWLLILSVMLLLCGKAAESKDAFDKIAGLVHCRN